MRFAYMKFMNVKLTYVQHIKNVCLLASFSHLNDMGFSCVYVFLHVSQNPWGSKIEELHNLSFIVYPRILNCWGSWIGCPQSAFLWLGFLGNL